jgi:hypothetical protein
MYTGNRVKQTFLRKQLLSKGLFYSLSFTFSDLEHTAVQITSLKKEEERRKRRRTGKNSSRLKISM